MDSTVIPERAREAAERPMGLPSTAHRAASVPLSMAERRVLLAVLDALAAAGACALSYLVWELRLGRSFVVPKLGPVFFVLVWLVALFMVDGYAAEIPASRVKSVAVTVKAIPIAAFLGFLFFFAQPYRMTRPVIALSVVMGAAAIVLTRWTLGRLLLREAFARRAVLVGASQVDPSLADALAAARFEIKVVEAIGVRDTLWARSGLPGLRETLDRHRAHQVILMNERDHGAREIAEACFNQGVRVVTAADLVERYQGRVPLEWVDDRWFLSLPTRDLSSRPYIMVRRIADVVFAALLSVLLLILLPFLSALIKLDSPGPIFFRQSRAGQYGRQMSILKLRTMRNDAELAGPQWANQDDSRVTRVGRVLRATRLDELPQAFNVLMGEMSFIGPRPERPEFVDQLEGEIPHYRARLAVKPGISGWAQVKHGYASSVQDTVRKLEYDLYYVKYQSLRLDLQIVLHTVFAVLGLRGR